MLGKRVWLSFPQAPLDVRTLRSKNVQSNSALLTDALSLQLRRVHGAAKRER